MLTSEDKRGQGQAMGLAERHARWLAPTAKGTTVLLETVLVMTVGMFVTWLIKPQDPLLIDSGFPWIWLLPTFLALRYGSLAGIGAALLLSGGVYFFQHTNAAIESFPRMFFLGGLVLVMVAGQFGDVWHTRLAQAKAISRYLDERLAALTKSHYLLRISHERLENDLLSRPTTLRDTLSQLRDLSLRETIQAKDSRALAGAQSTLQVVAQTCQLENAALYAWENERLCSTPAATIGAEFTLDVSDPLVQHCLETRKLAHLTQVHEGVDSRYIAAVPVLAGADQLLAVLVVEQMPFLSLTNDNLQLLLVLMGYYADSVEHAATTQDLQQALPTIPYEFAFDYAHLARLRQEMDIESTVVALTFDLNEERDALFDQVARSSRSMDAVWPIHGSQRRALLTLMPLTTNSAASGYLLRIEDMLQAQFGTNFTDAKIGIHMLSVPGQSGSEALIRLLQRAHLSKHPAAESTPSPPALTVSD